MSEKSDVKTGEVIVTLDFPVQLADRKLTELTMRRPTVKDHLEAEKGGGGDMASEVRIFGRMCKVNPEDLEMLDMADYQRLQVTYKGFLRKA